MTYSEPARTTTRRIPRILVAGLLVVIAAIAPALGYQLLASSSSTAASPTDIPRSDHRGARTEANGAVPDGVTVFDDEYPAVANLDPDLLEALREAAVDAADDRVEFQVNSGWRSPEYQEQLLREAVSAYDSEEEAARWVATPETSAHVSGDAVDIGPFDATAWLSEHGADYGLCQIYSVELVTHTALVKDEKVYRNSMIPVGNTGGLQVRSTSLNLLSALNTVVARGNWLNEGTAREPVAVRGLAAAKRLGIDRVYPGHWIWLGDQ